MRNPLVYRRLGSGCLVPYPSDYGSLIPAAHVSLGARACRHGGDEREVSVGLTEASIHTTAHSFDRSPSGLWVRGGDGGDGRPTGKRNVVIGRVTRTRPNDLSDHFLRGSSASLT
jgi:hypothetical protein